MNTKLISLMAALMLAAGATAQNYVDETTRIDCYDAGGTLAHSEYIDSQYFQYDFTMGGPYTLFTIRKNKQGKLEMRHDLKGTLLSSIDFVNPVAALMQKYSDGSKSARYKLAGFRIFDRMEGEEAWTEREMYCGEELLAPSVMTIKDARIWEELRLFNGTQGPSVVSRPLNIYRQITGFDKEFYVASPMRYDMKSGTIRIDGTAYKVDKATDDDLLVDVDYRFTTGDGSMGVTKWFVYYKKDDAGMLDFDKILHYDSSFEAKLAIIDMVRKEFGSVFNVQTYISDSPFEIIDLDKIEARLRAGGF